LKEQEGLFRKLLSLLHRYLIKQLKGHHSSYANKKKRSY
jgi:hypothetical protein